MILVISTRNDLSSIEICNWLTFFEKKYFHITEDQYITSIKIDFDRDIFKIKINDFFEIDLSLVNSVFYKNGNTNFKLDSSQKISSILNEFHNDEWLIVNDYMKSRFEQKKICLIGNIVNSKINKLEVLSIAKAIGLNIPKSIVISSKEELILHLNGEDSEWITKSISEMKPIFKKNDLYLNYTRQIKKEEKYINNFIPTLIQQKIDKKYEIRTFFIGNKFWSIAVFSQESDNTRIDSRNFNNKKMNHSVIFKLPSILERKIIKLANKLNLNSGTIDWIFSKTGDFYFLEINPLGLFRDISVYGNYDIEKEIAFRL